MSISPRAFDIARLSPFAASAVRTTSSLPALRSAAATNMPAGQGTLSAAAAQFVAQFDAAAADGSLSRQELQALHSAALQLQPSDLADVVRTLATDSRLQLWMADIDRHGFLRGQTGLDTQDRMALFRHLAASGDGAALAATFLALPAWESIWVSALRGEFLTAVGQANLADEQAQQLVEAMAVHARHDGWLQAQIETLVQAMQRTPSLQWLLDKAGLDPSRSPLTLRLIEDKLMAVPQTELQAWLFGGSGAGPTEALARLIEAKGWWLFDLEVMSSGQAPHDVVTRPITELVARIVPALDGEGLGRFWAVVGGTEWGDRYFAPAAFNAVSRRLARNPDQVSDFLSQLRASGDRGPALHRLFELTMAAGQGGRVRAILEATAAPMLAGTATHQEHWRFGYVYGSMLIALDRVARASGPAALAQAAVSIGDATLAIAWAYVKLLSPVKGLAGYHRGALFSGPFQAYLDNMLNGFANQQASQLAASLAALGYDFAQLAYVDGEPSANAPAWVYSVRDGIAAAFGFDASAPFGSR